LTAESERLAAELRAIGADAAVLLRGEDVCYATGFEVPPPIDAGAAFPYGPPVPWAGELVSDPRTGRRRQPGGPRTRARRHGRVDLSVRVRGYWADCTNVSTVDVEPTADQARFFRAARNEFEAAVEQLRPGLVASDGHEGARAAFAAAGFEPAHYTGHQIGVTVNEDPRLVPYDHMPIEPGMVFSVAPGIHGGDLRAGARCEGVMVVREDGPEVLPQFRWGMEV
jgi:Xaa-Pro aminopeptidase